MCVTAFVFVGGAVELSVFHSSCLWNVSPICFEAHLVGETCSERGVINHTREQIMEIVLFLFAFSEDYVWIEGSWRDKRH